MSVKDSDWAIWHESKVEAILQEVFRGYSEDEEPLIYRDPAYTSVYGVIGPYLRQPRRPLLAKEMEFNYIMSTIRISIEHLFGHVLKL
jgi:hypothetical protein